MPPLQPPKRENQTPWHGSSRKNRKKHPPPAFRTMAMALKSFQIRTLRPVSAYSKYGHQQSLRASHRGVGAGASHMDDANAPCEHRFRDGMGPTPLNPARHSKPVQQPPGKPGVSSGCTLLIQLGLEMPGETEFGFRRNGDPRLIRRNHKAGHCTIALHEPPERIVLICPRDHDPAIDHGIYAKWNTERKSKAR